jgi:hypothetical protein
MVITLSTTVATADRDPSQKVVTTMIANYVENRWLTRQMPKGLRIEGFAVDSVRSHGFVQTREAAYMLSMVERGADLLAASGNLGVEAAAKMDSLERS